MAPICKGPGPAAAVSGLCLLTCASPPCSPPRGQPLPVFTEPTHGLGERGSPPWVESHTHHFLMCHQPQWAHSAARADPGAWSPAWSRPGQKEDDSPVSSTSQRPGNSKAPEAIWASVRTLSKYAGNWQTSPPTGGLPQVSNLSHQPILILCITRK